MLLQRSGNNLPHCKDHNMNTHRPENLRYNFCESLNFILALTQRCFYVTELNICEIRVNCSYILTPCSTVLLDKLAVFQQVRILRTFYGIRRFITAFTSVRHMSLS